MAGRDDIDFGTAKIPRLFRNIFLPTLLGMASWSFIPILSGFKFDMTRGVIGFFPIIESESFTSFWSCGGAWGTVEISSKAIILSVIEGTLSLNAFEFDSRDGAVSVECDGKSIDFKRTEHGIVFADKHNIAKELHVIMK